MFTVAAQCLIPIEVGVIRCRVVAIPKVSAHPRLILVKKWEKQAREGLGFEMPCWRQNPLDNVASSYTEKASASALCSSAAQLQKLSSTLT
jgi:hypothetical protein